MPDPLNRKTLTIHSSATIIDTELVEVSLSIDRAQECIQIMSEVSRCHFGRVLENASKCPLSDHKVKFFTMA